MKQIVMGCAAFFTVMLTSSCNCTKSAADSATITGTEWQLASINGKSPAAADYNNGLPTINFTKDNKVNGKGGCNSYGGTYSINDKGGLAISQMMSTKMFCPGEGENTYMAALQTVNMAKGDKEKLTLLNDDKEVLVFTPKK